MLRAGEKRKAASALGESRPVGIGSRQRAPSAGPSPYELAAEIAPSHADALLMRRMQDANLREVRRLTNLLLKIKRQDRNMDPLETSDEDHLSHDISENKST